MAASKMLTSLQSLLPTNSSDLISLVDSNILGPDVFTSLCETVNKVYENQFIGLLQHCDILIDITWEKLNTGYWKDVDINWRHLYTIASVMKVLCETFLLGSDGVVTLGDVMKSCDMGLLMGAPILDNVLASMSSKLQALTVSKRQHLSNNTQVVDKKKLKLNAIVDEGKSIPRISCPSVQKFQNIMDAKQAVIITDAIEYWPAFTSQKWSLDYIKDVAGARTVPIELGSKYTDETWTQKLITVREFIEDYIEHPDPPTKGYLAQHQLFDQIPELLKDITIPTYCCLGNSDEVDINAWFGPSGTVSPLHYDAKYNLLTQVMGQKYIRIYSDEYTEHVYPHPDRLLHNTSRVDVECPDPVLFPLFKAAPYLECILGPREMLYIPPKFWHFVKSLEISFSISFWWE